MLWSYPERDCKVINYSLLDILEENKVITKEALYKLYKDISLDYDLELLNEYECIKIDNNLITYLSR